MNKSELIDVAATEADISKAAAGRALDAILDTVVKAVAKGDTVTLSGDNSGHHWQVASQGAEFTTYVWSDPVHQAVVEISNQLTATLSS